MKLTHCPNRNGDHVWRVTRDGSTVARGVLTKGGELRVESSSESVMKAHVLDLLADAGLVAHAPVTAPQPPPRVAELPPAPKPPVAPRKQRKRPRKPAK